MTRASARRVSRTGSDTTPNQTLQQTAGACRLSQVRSSLGPRRCRALSFGGGEVSKERIAMDKEIVVAVLTFLSSLVWPAVFIWLVIRFRPQVAQLLNRLSTVKVAGSEFAFQQAAVN